jgi:hypothetical protein
MISLNCGSGGSGKTSLMLNMFQNKNMYRGKLIFYFKNILFFRIYIMSDNEANTEGNTEAPKDTEGGPIEKPKKPRSEKQLAAFKIAQQKRAQM